MLKKRPQIIALLISVLFALSCSTSMRTNHTLVNRLKNRGPVGLSTDNPYLAANMFLSEESRSSEIIGGFIDHRGPPPALEIEGDIFNDLTLKFYYPAEREFFIAEEIGGSWIINGPHRIPEELMSGLLSLTGGGDKTPILAGGDKAKGSEPTTPFARLPTDLEPADPSKDPFIGTMKTQTPKSGTTMPSQTSGMASQNNSSRKNSSRTLAIERVRMSNKSKPAEVTPKGDLVHYVNFAAEDLKLISEWYTDDPENASRLARINRVNGRLRVGDMIIIPSYLVTYNGRLTQQALAALQRSL